MPRLSAPPLVCELPALAPNLEPVPTSCILRDRAARAPIDAAADRFARTPGPAERAARLARITDPQQHTRGIKR